MYVIVNKSIVYLVKSQRMYINVDIVTGTAAVCGDTTTRKHKPDSHIDTDQSLKLISGGIFSNQVGTMR